MRSGVLISIIAGLVAVLGVDQVLKVHHGGAICAFGWSAPASASLANYSTAARVDLRVFLAQHGFTSEPSGGTQWAGMHSAKESDEWFVGTVDGSLRSLPFHIDIRTAQRDASGLAVDVVYDFRDYSWRVTAAEKQVKASIDLIGKWWSDYQDQHPGGPPRS